MDRHVAQLSEWQSHRLETLRKLLCDANGVTGVDGQDGGDGGEVREMSLESTRSTTATAASVAAGSVTSDGAEVAASGKRALMEASSSGTTTALKSQNHILILESDSDPDSDPTPIPIPDQSRTTLCLRHGCGGRTALLRKVAFLSCCEFGPTLPP